MQYRPHEYQRYGEDMIVQRNMLGLLWEMGSEKCGYTVRDPPAEIRPPAGLQGAGDRPQEGRRGTWTGEARKWDHLNPCGCSW
jgi:hypothetical protein